MRIHHVAIYVHNLEQCKAFYQTYFSAVASASYHNPSTGLRTYFLSFAGDTRLELMSRPELGAPQERATVDGGWIHLAISVGGRDAVDAIAARLEKDGYRLLSKPRRTGDGYYEACVLDPEGNQIEITE